MSAAIDILTGDIPHHLLLQENNLPNLICRFQFTNLSLKS